MPTGNCDMPTGNSIFNGTKYANRELRYDICLQGTIWNVPTRNFIYKTGKQVVHYYILCDML